MAELRESHDSQLSTEPFPPPADPETRPLTIGASGLARTHPGSLPSGDDGLLAPGARLDDYEVVAKLGGGGMGQVYRVRHVRLDREFALKIISSRHISPEARQRFEREMKAAGRTNHPNVILATDAGESQGLHYLVMELVRGTDLAGLVKRIGPLPVADACEIVRQAALGLQAIHEAGLVHRDIKPHNLMLTPDGSVKVLDLGLARLVGEKGDTLTENNSLGGTADYMAPEQAVDLHSVTIAADLYSLGCTLYCLLAEHPPFGDGRFSSFASKLFAHRSEPVPPIAALRPELAQRPELLRLLDRLLAKEPSTRPSEPRAVAEALDPLAVGHDLTKLFSDGSVVRRDGAFASGRPSHRPLIAASVRSAGADRQAVHRQIADLASDHGERCNAGADRRAVRLGSEVASPGEQSRSGRDHCFFRPPSATSPPGYATKPGEGFRSGRDRCFHPHTATSPPSHATTPREWFRSGRDRCFFGSPSARSPPGHAITRPPEAVTRLD